MRRQVLTVLDSDMLKFKFGKGVRGVRHKFVGCAENTATTILNYVEVYNLNWICARNVVRWLTQMN